MSDLEQWLASARTTWRRWQTQLARLSPGSKVTSAQLTAQDASARWRAVHALTQRPQLDLLSGLLALSDDPDEIVRAEVADVLVAWGPEVTLEPVRRALMAQPSPAAASTLLTALARLPDPANRSVIMSWLDHDEAAVRAAALMALAALCDDKDISRLEEALQDEGLPVQRAIMAMLCAANAGPLAEKALTSSDRILRQRAAQARARIQRRREEKEHPAIGRRGRSRPSEPADETENR